MASWLQLRRLILRGPEPTRDPYRLAFHHVQPRGDYSEAPVGYQRSLGGDGVAAGFPYPYNNPIGAGIMPTHPLGIFGPPPAQYHYGALFFQYPTPGQSIAEVVQPGGPLYDPATLAAILGQPGEGVPTTPIASAPGAGFAGRGHSF